jgi:hypothetical protein
MALIWRKLLMAAEEKNRPGRLARDRNTMDFQRTAPERLSWRAPWHIFWAAENSPDNSASLAARSARPAQ